MQRDPHTEHVHVCPFIAHLYILLAGGVIIILYEVAVCIWLSSPCRKAIDRHYIYIYSYMKRDEASQQLH